MSVIQNDIVPITEIGVGLGNKLFGGAVLKRTDLSLVVAETNNEMSNPLWHGEIATLNRFFELEDRPNIEELIFLSTHEPCSMCLSALAWSGFKDIFYFFSHEESRDNFEIPHDLKILKQIFNIEPGKYNKKNIYWTCSSINKLILEMELDKISIRELKVRSNKIRSEYDKLSNSYQLGKKYNEIPLN